MVGPFCWAANCLAMAMAAGGNKPDIIRFEGGKFAIVGVGNSEGRVTLLAKEVNLTGGLSAGGCIVVPVRCESLARSLTCMRLMNLLIITRRGTSYRCSTHQKIPVCTAKVDDFGDLARILVHDR